jgi:hypothetical protein
MIDGDPGVGAQIVLYPSAKGIELEHPDDPRLILPAQGGNPSRDIWMLSRVAEDDIPEFWLAIRLIRRHEGLHPENDLVWADFLHVGPEADNEPGGVPPVSSSDIEPSPGPQNGRPSLPSLSGIDRDDRASCSDSAIRLAGWAAALLASTIEAHLSQYKRTRRP